MKSYEQLVREGIINDRIEYGRLNIANFYQEQLEKLYELGIGKATENGVAITQGLIDITKKRLFELQPLFKNKKENK